MPEPKLVSAQIVGGKLIIDLEDLGCGCPSQVEVELPPTEIAPELTPEQGTVTEAPEE